MLPLPPVSGSCGQSQRPSREIPHPSHPSAQSVHFAHRLLTRSRSRMLNLHPDESRGCAPGPNAPAHDGDRRCPNKHLASWPPNATPPGAPSNFRWPRGPPMWYKPSHGRRCANQCALPGSARVRSASPQLDVDGALPANVGGGAKTVAYNTQAAEETS